MPSITFLQAGSRDRRVVDARAGTNLMRAALEGGVDGIVAACGGECACSTCHIYLRDEWADVCGSPSEQENDTLELAPGRQAGSRLSCQIEVTQALDGMIVEVPESQAD